MGPEDLLYLSINQFGAEPMNTGEARR